MTSTPSLRSAHAVLALVLLGGIAFAIELHAELDPWTGEYEVSSIERGGGSWTFSPEETRDLKALMGYIDIRREYLEIRRDGYLKTGTTWVCGVEKDTISGDMKFEKGRIALYERTFPGQEPSPIPTSFLDFTSDHSIVREVGIDGNRTIKLVFRRVGNAPTMLDWLGFR